MRNFSKNFPAAQPFYFMFYHLDGRYMLQTAGIAMNRVFNIKEDLGQGLSKVYCRKKAYFNRSKVFWRICQSFRPANLLCAAWLISSSRAFLVGFFT